MSPSWGGVIHDGLRSKKWSSTFVPCDLPRERVRFFARLVAVALVSKASLHLLWSAGCDLGNCLMGLTFGYCSPGGVGTLKHSQFQRGSHPGCICWHQRTVRLALFRCSRTATPAWYRCVAVGGHGVTDRLYSGMGEGNMSQPNSGCDLQSMAVVRMNATWAAGFQCGLSVGSGRGIAIRYSTLWGGVFKIDPGGKRGSAFQNFF